MYRKGEREEKKKERKEITIEYNLQVFLRI